MRDYIRKERILKPLYIGIDRRWVAAKLSVKQGKHRQLSVAKLLLSAALKIHVDKLPHSVWFIDQNSKNVILDNLTLQFEKIGKPWRL